MDIRTVIDALQALRGVAQTTAATIVSELGSLSRFQSQRPLMGYTAWSPGSIQVGIECNAVQSLRREMPIYEGLSLRPSGLSASAQRHWRPAEKTEVAGLKRRSEKIAWKAQH